MFQTWLCAIFCAEALFCTLLRPFAPFCALLRSLCTCVCARLRSFALICVFLHPIAFRLTALGNLGCAFGLISSKIQRGVCLVVRIARPASLAIWHRGRSRRRPNRSRSPNRRHLASLDLKKHPDFSHRRPTSQDFRKGVFCYFPVISDQANGFSHR